MNDQTYIVLNDGNRIPQLGVGVFQVAGDDLTQQVCEEALGLGYRHIDTAHAYQNERGVGAAVRSSGIPREEVWITSKLWPSEYGDSASDAAIDKMLKRIGINYLDMLLLHQQFGDYLGAWKALEAAVADGRVRSIGLSNFESERLEEVLGTAKILPSVLQVETHPYYQQLALKERIAPYGIVLESWYPLGHGDPELLGEQVFTEIGSKYGKTNAQVILRWHTQVGNIVFPRSTKPQRLAENLDIFDFTLTDEEVSGINELERGKRYFTMTLEEQEANLSGFIPAD